MDKWILYSIISIFFNSMWSLSIKYNLEINKINQYDLTFYYVLIAFILCLFINTNPYFDNISFISGLCTGLAIILITKAIKDSNNPGLAIAIVRTQVIITTLLSVLIFKTTIDFRKLFSILIIFIAIIYITIESDDKLKYSDIYSLLNTENMWIPIAFTAGIFLSIKDIFQKLALIKKINISNVLFNLYLGGLITTFVFKLYKTKTIFINLKTIDDSDEKTINKKFKKFAFMTLTGISYFILVYYITLAMDFSPNIGYVKAINSSSIILTTFLAGFIFKDAKVNKKMWIGIGMVLTGIMGLAIT